MKNTLTTKTCEDKVTTKFTHNKTPKDNTYYSCIAAPCRKRKSSSSQS